MPAKLHKKTPLLETIAMSPLLMSQDGEGLFQTSIEHIEAHEHSERFFALANDNTALAAADDAEFWGNPHDRDDFRNYFRPYKVIDGVLQIPIMGVLLDKFPWQLGRWATGYKYIEMALRRGLADPNVRGIALVIDSPGGEVSGCFELGDKVYAARSVKPIRAFAANHAYSAAYVMFSSANMGTVTRSGGAGSIGVVTMHISYQDALTKSGIAVTFIASDPSKTEGNRYENLTKAAKERIQARINKIYGVFSSTVARNRGMSEEEVVALKAYTYDADEAVENGLADRVGALEEELVVFTTEVNEDGDEYMATPQANVTGKKAGDDGEGIDQATYEKGLTDAKAEGKAEGITEGMTAQKDRISAIIGSEEAKTRPAAALHCALNSDMTVEQTAKFLAGLPAEKAAPAVEGAGATETGKPKTNAGTKVEGRNHFTESMNNGQQPNVGSGTEDEDTGDESEKATNSILGVLAQATGAGKKKDGVRKGPFG